MIQTQTIITENNLENGLEDGGVSELILICQIENVWLALPGDLIIL